MHISFLSNVDVPLVVDVRLMLQFVFICTDPAGGPNLKNILAKKTLRRGNMILHTEEMKTLQHRLHRALGNFLINAIASIYCKPTRKWLPAA